MVINNSYKTIVSLENTLLINMKHIQHENIFSKNYCYLTADADLTPN
jgi:hypothetical protein